MKPISSVSSNSSARRTDLRRGHARRHRPPHHVRLLGGRRTGRVRIVQQQDRAAARVVRRQGAVEQHQAQARRQHRLVAGTGRHQSRAGSGFLVGDPFLVAQRTRAGRRPGLLGRRGEPGTQCLQGVAGPAQRAGDAPTRAGLIGPQHVPARLELRLRRCQGCFGLLLTLLGDAGGRVGDVELAPVGLDHPLHGFVTTAGLRLVLYSTHFDSLCIHAGCIYRGFAHVTLPPVPADAGYGLTAPFRRGLSARGLSGRCALPCLPST